MKAKYGRGGRRHRKQRRTNQAPKKVAPMAIRTVYLSGAAATDAFIRNDHERRTTSYGPFPEAL